MNKEKFPMRGKHSIVTPESTVRRRLKIATAALVPAMVLASLGVASAELSADEELAKEIECGIPGSGRTDCPVSVEEAPEPEPTESPEAAGAGAKGTDQSSTESDAGAAGLAGDGTSQEPAPVQVSGSSVIDDPQGFADNLSCDMMERFEMSDLQCDPVS